MSKDYPEYDKQTRQWFRWVTPTSREYAPEYNFVGRPERTEPKQEPPSRTCPLRAHRPKCNPYCALYSGDRCKVAVEPANNATAAKKCPFDAYTCNSGCAAYNNGCGFIHFLEKGL